MAVPKADAILGRVYEDLDLAGASASDRYDRIDDIVAALKDENQRETIPVPTTGAISERLCKLGLDAAVDGIYRRLPRYWKWVGDFAIAGQPFNLIVSVKSFKARERLLASGTGHVLSPTYGWGLFDDVDEWTAERVRSYLYRGFAGIYVPNHLFAALSEECQDIRNLNGRPLVRSLGSFVTDLQNMLDGDMVDIRKV